MKRNIVLAAIAVALVALVSASPVHAALPFGSFGGQVGGGNSGQGSMPLFGWALATNGVAAVDVLVDGHIDGRAIYGRSRPGVQAQFPGFPDSALAGWVYQLDTTHYLNGPHTVSARVRSKTGETADLKGRQLLFTNVPGDLAPFGKIEFPNANAELTGDCSRICQQGLQLPGQIPGIFPDGDVDIFVPDNFTSRRYSVVQGWALDSGVNLADSGVGYTELLIDGSLWSPLGYNSKTGCFYDANTGGLSNCYGLRRLDIANIYPSLRDSLHSGFRFVLDVSQLLNCNLYTPGHHTLSVRAGDQFETVREIARIPVTFSCADFGTDDPAVGQIDVPAAGLLYSGTLQVTGWALDFQGISLISVLVDGADVANGNVTLARPGVTALYPGYPQSVAPGFKLAVDTTKLSNGVHSLQVIVSDTLGSDTLLGEVRFTVANTHQ